MDNKTFKVRVNDNVREMWDIHPYRGQVLEVRQALGNYYVVGDVAKGLYIRYDDCVRIEEPFEPRSGMVFETVNGRFGLFVGTDNGLWMIFDADGKYESHTKYLPEFLESDTNTCILRVYKGMNDFGNAGLNHNLRTYATSERALWERKAKAIEVKLNDKHTAVVEGENVIVGCQTIPVKNIRELIKQIDEAK